MNSGPSIQVRKHVPSGTIVLNRPAKRNALTRLMLMQLKEALEDLRQERSVRAVILTGAGDAFCAGIDLMELQQTRQASNAQSQWRDDAVAYKELIEVMLRHPKPIVAAVNGPAVGAGAGLVLASDIVIAGPEAQFGVPEPRLGLVSGMVCPLLVFRVGAGLAANLLLSAKLISAEESHRLGIFQEIVKTDLLWARAHEIAGQCAASAPEALQLTKRLLNETVGEYLTTLLAVGAAATATARTTEAAEEGLSAFVEKRPPKWR